MEGKTLNIVSGSGTILMEIIDSICEMTRSRVKCDFKSSPSFDVSVNVPNIAKAKEVLKWQPVVSLPRGIEMTREWLAGVL